MHPILFFHHGKPFATYSLLVWMGYLIGVLWLRTQLKHHGATPAQFWGMVVSVILGALLGGKIGYVLVEWKDFIADPMEMIHDWNTGWVFWSGLLCGAGSGLIYQIWHNRHYRPRAYLPVADDCVAALALGHVFGRLGCLMEGCCHGRPTRMPWGISFVSPACSVIDSLKGIPLHPTQLYEAFGEACAFLFMATWLLPRIRCAKYQYGTAFIGYFLYYAILRFVIEVFRGDDRGLLLSSALSPAQWTSLFAAVIAGVVLLKKGVRERDAARRSLFSD